MWSSLASFFGELKLRGNGADAEEPFSLGKYPFSGCRIGCWMYYLVIMSATMAGLARLLRCAAGRPFL
jgi:hypothetical protein